LILVHRQQFIIMQLGKIIQADKSSSEAQDSEKQSRVYKFEAFLIFSCYFLKR
jgi:hypothetical protein